MWFKLLYMEPAHTNECICRHNTLLCNSLFWRCCGSHFHFLLFSYEVVNWSFSRHNLNLSNTAFTECTLLITVFRGGVSVPEYGACWLSVTLKWNRVIIIFIFNLCKIQISQSPPFYFKEWVYPWAILTFEHHSIDRKEVWVCVHVWICACQMSNSHQRKFN